MNGRTAPAALTVVEGGATAGWEAAYREHVVPVYRFIYARTGNRPDAEDITTQVFMRALPRLRINAAPGEMRSYLITTARTVLADHWTARFGVQVNELGDDVAAPPEAVESEGNVRRVAALLDLLPDRYRQVLELRFLRGYSIRETAHEMGVSVANAKVLQLRALRRAAGVEFEG